MGKGTVYLVGAGPTDSELLTVKARRLIMEADAIVYDRLVGPDILSLFPQDAETYYVGKEASNHSVPQEDICQMLADLAEKHEVVVRLKGGDPNVFGRGAEEAEVLKEAGVDFHFVPGITAALGTASYAGIPLTHRDHASSIYIATAHFKEGSDKKVPFEELVALKDTTLVFYMGVGSLPQIARGFLQAGMDEHTPVAIVERATSSAQRTIHGTMGTIHQVAEESQVSAPALIIVGSVTELDEILYHVDDLPLYGRRVIITRSQGKKQRFARMLRDQGAETVHIPTIQVQHYDQASISQALDQATWLCFTSESGVKHFSQQLQEEKIDIRSLQDAKIAAIGSVTEKALAEINLYCDFVPSVFEGKHFAEEFEDQVDKDKDHIAFISPYGVKNSAVEILEDQGFDVSMNPVYEIVDVQNPALDDFAFRDTDILTFTSCATVRAFQRQFPDFDFPKHDAYCIGHTTAKCAEEVGFQTKISDQATLDSLRDLIVEDFGA